MGQQQRDGTFVEIADRVLLARHREWDVSVGLVLGRDGAVLVDSHGSPRQGAEVLARVTALPGAPTVTHVVNTHVHFDHAFGNRAFPDATVHAHESLRTSLPAHAARTRAELARELAADPDAAEYGGGWTRQDARELLSTPLRGPDCTFATAATIDLGDRAVVLAWRGRGHTDGDVTVRITDGAGTDVLFLGDLAEESAPPSYGSDSHPLEWADTVAAHLSDTEPSTVFVPGHGAPMDHGEVWAQQAELARVATVIRERLDARMPLGAAQQEPADGLAWPMTHLASAFARAWGLRG